MKKTILSITLMVLFFAGAKAQTSPISLLVYKGTSSDGKPLVIDSIAYSNVDSLQIGDRIIRFFRDGAVVKEYPSMGFDSVIVDYDRDQLPPLVPTIWESILSGSDSKMKRYLLSQNYSVLNSGYRQAGNDSTGNIVYIDSVVTHGNYLWPGITGYLNDRNSEYVAVMLEDDAFDDGYEAAQRLYSYHLSQGEHFPQGADSMYSYRNVQINNSVIRGFFYPGSEITEMNNSSADYCRTVGGDRVDKDIVHDIISGADSYVDAANGPLYYSSDFPSALPAIWRKNVSVEAENLYRLLYTGANQDAHVITVDSIGPEIAPDPEHTVSGNRYLQVLQSKAQSASVVFGITNTLADEYDVWVTFVPASMVPGVTTPLPGSARVAISYSAMESAIGMISTKMIIGSSFDIDAHEITRVKVAELPSLSVCFDGFMEPDEYLYGDSENPVSTDYLNKKYGVKIQISNDVSITDDTKDHNLYIDCIELVPRRAE